MPNPQRYAKKRFFSGKHYITDYETYDDKLTAKSVVTYLKTKDVMVRARIIKKKKFVLVYYDQDTYNKLKYGNLKIPDFDKIPEDIVNEAKESLGLLDKEEEKQESKEQFKNWREEQQDRFQKSRKDKFEVIKLKKEVSTTELMQTSIKKKQKKVKDEVEQGINTVLNHVENEFFRSCPKCGGTMKPTFMVIGREQRISVFQCRDCKFYIPRRFD
ncbi:MAG: hypothetical protein GF364_13045 [Candidatus Lokiarchaeota archaeon]|nr:hypothetical protein [Candidatus Lokiarchaeota archaeon]